MFRLRLSLLLLVLLPSASFAVVANVTRGGADVRFGRSVSDAGDVNNDGRPDFIVGAPIDDTDCFECGRAYLWLAQPGGYSSVPSLIFDDGTGNTPHLGWNVAGIGDVNDDGYDDVAVGAPLDDGAGQDAGAVFVYFGGATPNSVPDLTLRGVTGDDRFGWWISRGGDLNDDGIEDFLVGAPYADEKALDAGSVYLFLGSSGAISTTPARVFVGEVAGDFFGWSVAEVPDFRGNGVASFVVGAPGYGLDAGRAYLFYGGSNNSLPNTTVDVIFGGADGGDDMGWSVSSIGLFDGDSRSDVAVGAPGDLGGRGAVRVWLGAANPAASPAWNMDISGGTGGDRFGEAVSGIGDHRGTTREDLLAGAPMRDAPSANSGIGYIFAGGQNYTSVSQATVVNPRSPAGGAFDGDNFGFAVAGLGGDMDADGKQDCIIGSPVANNSLNVASGSASLIGSAGGIVPVAEIPFVGVPGSGSMELRFGGLALTADRVGLWSVAVASRLLAQDSDFQQAGDMLAVILAADQLAGLDEVELRLWHGVDESSQKFQLPAIALGGLRLFEPVPNPFNPRTLLRFSLPGRAAYELTIVDARGRLVRTLASGVGGPGELQFPFDGRDDRGARLSSGSYRAVLRSTDGIRAQGLTLIE